MEGHICKFVCLVIVKQHIFRCGGGVSETVTDIEPERNIVCKAGSTAPVPSVLISLDTAAPVQYTEGIFRFKPVFYAVEENTSLCRHTVDFLIEIEVIGFF